MDLSPGQTNAKGNVSLGSKNHGTENSVCSHELRKLRLGKITQMIRGIHTEISVKLICECGNDFFFGGKYIQTEVKTK